MLKADAIATRLSADAQPAKALRITPWLGGRPSESGSASIDLRLGCWFVVLRRTRVAMLDVYDEPEQIPSEEKLAKEHYVPFGKAFVLHPRSFVLGVTLEWIKMPHDLGAYVVGRSSWGRRGLIIATATGVHPGFTGCLTLELTNLGEIPISIRPGTTICQLFFHGLEAASKKIEGSSFAGRRKPALGDITLDGVARCLARQLE